MTPVTVPPLPQDNDCMICYEDATRDRDKFFCPPTGRHHPPLHRTCMKNWIFSNARAECPFPGCGHLINTSKPVSERMFSLVKEARWFTILALGLFLTAQASLKTRTGEIDWFVEEAAQTQTKEIAFDLFKLGMGITGTVGLALGVAGAALASTKRSAPRKLQKLISTGKTAIGSGLALAASTLAATSGALKLAAQATTKLHERLQRYAKIEAGSVSLSHQGRFYQRDGKEYVFSTDPYSMQAAAASQEAIGSNIAAIAAPFAAGLATGAAVKTLREPQKHHFVTAAVATAAVAFFSTLSVGKGGLAEGLTAAGLSLAGTYCAARLA